ncbi:ribulokinase [Candidatus Poribacteria bacterium]|nr:ribulokinase [Candidatus Poribacteria bacterium]
MSKFKYVIGMDFGTDSVRSVIVDILSGEEISSQISYFRRWAEGKYCSPDKNQFRQHPLDHIKSLEESVVGALKKASPDTADNIIGIGVDTTGSTPAPIDKDGTVLALKEGFTDNPNAMFILWKDHTAVEEAELINKVARSWGGEDYTKYEGGVYSSEWFWSKILHILIEDNKVREAAFSWVEHADWIPAVLTGNMGPLKLKRSRCAAGHKAMWHASWGGLPPEEFLSKVSPLLSGLRDRLYNETYTSDNAAGKLTAEWAARLGLKEGIPVSVGAYDAHMGAVGAGISPGTFVKIIGTSCCDIAVSPKNEIGEKLVAGICGQVDGSVIPGMIGLEAGQSAYGDVYAWFRDLLSWPLENLLSSAISKKEIDKAVDLIIPRLTEAASRINPGESSLVVLDWLNGRRTPYADQKLKGAILGVTLGTDAPKLFRALVEATAFGAKAIIERFNQENIAINQVVAIGGIPKKSSLVMQILSDVLDMPVKVAKSEQAVALGAAMFGAVVTGIYKSVEEAQKNMGSGFETTYYPDKKKAFIYNTLYAKYKKLGNILEDELRK